MAGLRAKDEIGAESLARRLNVRARARADGAAGRPALDARDLAEAERDIAAAVSAARADVERNRASLAAETERNLRANAPAPADFAGLAADARLALRQIEGRFAHAAAEASARAQGARRDLQRFRDENSIRRIAIYPSSRLMQSGLLLAAAVFESLFSAALFAETDERGLLGGAVTAIGLSGANVTLGFLAGFLGLRYLQHVRWPFKTLGALGFTALAAVAIYLNFFAAIWRQTLTTANGADDAGNFLAQAFALTSPQAIVLLMLGGGVWVFSALKGYSGFDDPYPDYGKLDRAASEAGETLAALREDAREELEEPVGAARAAVSAELEKLRAALDRMTRLYDDAAQSVAALDAEDRRLDDAARAAIQLYRQENLAARDGPGPAYFSDLPPNAGAEPDSLAGSGALIADARAAHAVAQTAAAKALEALIAELDAATARLEQSGQSDGQSDRQDDTQDERWA